MGLSERIQETCFHRALTSRAKAGTFVATCHEPARPGSGPVHPIELDE